LKKVDSLVPSSVIELKLMAPWEARQVIGKMAKTTEVAWEGSVLGVEEHPEIDVGASS
jgi:hypothetical protein